MTWGSVECEVTQARWWFWLVCLVVVVVATSVMEFYELGIVLIYGFSSAAENPDLVPEVNCWILRAQ